MNMNMNMNNQMINSGFRNNIDYKINVKFIDENNKETTIAFNIYEKTRKLLEKYLIDTSRDLREFIFTFNNNILIPGFTLEKNGVIENATIFVKQKIQSCLTWRRASLVLQQIVSDNWQKNWA